MKEDTASSISTSTESQSPASGSAAARRSGPKIGLACAGGGIEGAVYEIGALCALEEVIEGIDFTKAHVYVGVSAGAIVTSSLANGITPRQMSRAILSRQPEVHPITPATFFTPAYMEYAHRVAAVPRRMASMLWDYAWHPQDISIGGSLSRITELLPVGVFDNSPIRKYMQRNFAYEGRSDRFTELKSRLRIVATDLDSSKSVVFGNAGLDDVPISLAVQASTALPAIYTPVEINGRHYIDGVAQRTVHASVAMDEGADFTICINPIVPYEAAEAVAGQHDPLQEMLIERGLPAVLSQTFRTMIHSRMNVGISRYKYQQSYAGRDLIVIEPKTTDYRMFFTNIFSFSSRQEVCEYAYQSTRDFLRENIQEFDDTLQKHGLRLRKRALSRQNRTLYKHPAQRPGHVPHTSLELGQTLQRLDGLLARI
jgi:predicted acylesterase/phospholipase RssA